MKALLALAILLALPGAAAADYQPTQVWVGCLIPSWWGVDSINAAEFAIDHLPDASMCQITAYWNTDLVIGDLETGIALAFVDPLEAPLAIFGHLEFIAWEPFPDDYRLEVVPSEAGNLVIVDAGTWTEIPVQGGLHIFNPTDASDYACNAWVGDELCLWTTAEALEWCQDIKVFTTPVDESSWSAVKALY
jgi:hypothetical protein